MKTTRRSNGTRFAIVIETVSDTAAKTMQNGKTTKISASSMTGFRQDASPHSIRHAPLTAGEKSAADSPGRSGRRIRKGRPVGTAFPDQPMDRPILLQRGGDVVELGADRVADGAGADHDGQSDEGSDQTVFDGGRARFVLHETCKDVGHARAPTPCYSTSVNFGDRLIG